MKLSREQKFGIFWILLIAGLVCLCLFGCRKDATTPPDTSPFKVTCQVQDSSHDCVVVYSSSLMSQVCDTIKVAQKIYSFETSYNEGGKYFSFIAWNTNQNIKKAISVKITIDGKLFKQDTCSMPSCQCNASGTYIR